MKPDFNPSDVYALSDQFGMGKKVILNHVNQLVANALVEKLANLARGDALQSY